MHIVIIVKKTGHLYGFRHSECHERKLQINVLFYNGAKFDFRLLISHLAEKKALIRILVALRIVWKHF